MTVRQFMQIHTTRCLRNSIFEIRDNGILMEKIDSNRLNDKNWYEDVVKKFFDRTIKEVYYKTDRPVPIVHIIIELN